MRGINRMKEILGYKLIESRWLEDVKSTSYLYEHEKTGARVAILSNDDDNKAFYIGFRTTPENEKGIPHIIEHSVLCGSKKFPIKDPFVELAKGSLNTYLNAMTYPDKTVYPVASYNDKDFKNLMEVYMDAVCYPNIKQVKEIFMQEGWHFELEDMEAPLTINGVVYNEMKGAYSSSEEVIYKEGFQVLFPENTYSKDSGGNPKKIPELSYEEFIEFYETYYHPSNSYIYLYGDVDIEERLTWLDQEYLSKFEKREVSSEIKPQTAFKEMVDHHAYFAVAEEEPVEDNSTLAYNKVISTALDKKVCQAFEILDYALVSAPGAPIRQALIDAGIGQDVYGYFDSGLLQPVYMIVAKNANPKDKENFKSIIEDKLTEIVKNGIDKNSLLAAINSQEFRFREADYGQFPKGLLYGLTCLDSWIYDGDPFLYLEVLDLFEELKAEIETGYFENLVQKYLLDNQHGAIVLVEPKKGMAAQEEKELEEALLAKKNALTVEEKEKLIQETKELHKYQETPSNEEDLKKIPLLKREDLRKEANPFFNEEKKINDVTYLCHNIETNGIDYIHMLFDISDFTEEEIAWAGMLRAMIGLVNTENFTYAQFVNEVNIHTGGIYCGTSFHSSVEAQVKSKMTFELNIKVLDSKLKEAMSLAKEMLFTSNLRDKKRVKELLVQTKSRLQMMLNSSAHQVATMRALSANSFYARFQEWTHGISFYQEICNMIDLLEKDEEAYFARLEELLERILVRKRLLISFTGNESLYLAAKDDLEEFCECLKEGTNASEMKWDLYDAKKEAFTDASQIQYVARTGFYKEEQEAFSSALRVLKTILSYEYLWTNVRVLGGAYGCMCSFLRTGEMYLVSYRDPNLKKTMEVYEAIPQFVKEFKASEREMTQYIIGTLGSLDTPLTPEAKGHRSLIAYLGGLSYDMVQRERDDMLQAKDSDIRALHTCIEKALSQGQICVIGNEIAIKKEEDMFDCVAGLLDK